MLAVCNPKRASKARVQRGGVFVVSWAPAVQVKGDVMRRSTFNAVSASRGWVNSGARYKEVSRSRGVSLSVGPDDRVIGFGTLRGNIIATDPADYEGIRDAMRRACKDITDMHERIFFDLLGQNP